MKKEYETPVMEVLSFEVSDVVMDCEIDTCVGFTCPDGICVLDNGTCRWDGIVSGL